MRATKKQRFARASYRGAIMVEAIVVISFFILCFLGVGYFRSLYDQKLHVQRLARASALTHAMGACKTDPRTSIERDMGMRRIQDRTEEGLPFDAVKIPNIPHGEKGAEALSRVRKKMDDTGIDKITKVTLEGDASMTTKRKPDGPEQGFRGTAASTSYVVCGDPVTGDRYERMVDTIAELF